MVGACLPPAREAKLKRSACVQNKSTEGVCINLPPFVTFGIFQVSFVLPFRGRRKQTPKLFLMSVTEEDKNKLSMLNIITSLYEGKHNLA